jgi:hypothetical protein
MKTLHFLNLTDGLEWIPLLGDNPYQFLRIESTSIEKNDWMGLLLNLDHNLLINLAIGNKCIVYDCGTRRPISKTISKGIPYIKSFLTDMWISKINFRAETKLKQLVKKKIQYYNRYLATEEVNIIGRSMMTTNNGNKDYYREILLNANRSKQRSNCSSNDFGLAPMATSAFI